VIWHKGTEIDFSIKCPVQCRERKCLAMKTGKEIKHQGFQLLNPTERMINQKKAELKARFGKGNFDVLIHELQVNQVELELQNAELKRAKREAEQLKNKFEGLFDFSPAGYITFDHEGYIQEANYSACRMLGFSKSFLLQKMFHVFVVNEMWETFNRFFINTLCEDEKQSCQLKLKHKDGVFLYAQLEGIRVEDEENGLPQCRVAIIDITERKIAEESLMKTTEELLFYKKKLEEKSMEMASLYIKLARSEKELRNENIIKSKVISAISEELSKPVKAINEISMKINQGENIAHSADSLSQLQEEAQKISAVIEKLSEAPIRPDGRLRIAPAEIDLHLVVDEIFGLLKINADHKQVKFRPVVNKKTKVIADKMMLSAVIKHLMTNAITISPIGGEINFSAQEKQQFVEINISKADSRDKKINLNSLLKGVKGKYEKGQPLELLLCQEMIEAQGGRACFGHNDTGNYTFFIPKPKSKNKNQMPKTTSRDAA
jgi:PAS domain S-box-containing protein